MEKESKQEEIGFKDVWGDKEVVNVQLVETMMDVVTNYMDIKFKQLKNELIKDLKQTILTDIIDFMKAYLDELKDAISLQHSKNNDEKVPEVKQEWQKNVLNPNV